MRDFPFRAVLTASPLVSQTLDTDCKVGLTLTNFVILVCKMSVIHRVMVRIR